jgi:hypothetical protein
MQFDCRAVTGPAHQPTNCLVLAILSIASREFDQGVWLTLESCSVTV